MKTARGAILVPLSIVLLSCGGGEAVQPAEPSPAPVEPPPTLRVSYAPSVTVIPASAPVSCTHHFAPINLRATLDHDVSVRLQDQGAGWTAELPSPTAGTHLLQVIDIALCDVRPGCPIALEGVSVNGVQLTRTVPEDALACIALAFELDEDGSVRP